VVTRTVRDSAAMLDATGYPEPGSPYAPAPKHGSFLEELNEAPGKLKIAFSSQTPRGKPIDPEIQSALEATVKLLQELGHNVTEQGLGIDYPEFYKAQATVSAANAAAGYARRVAEVGREAEEEELEPLTWSGIRAGRGLSGEQVMLAWQELRVLSRKILSIYDHVDVFLSPVLGTSVPPVGLIDPVNLEPRDIHKRQSKAFPFTPPMNITGQPAMSVPLFQDSLGLPIGMMFAGRYGDEATLFRLAAQLEQAAPWNVRKPPIWN
jgi:amidase